MPHEDDSQRAQGIKKSNFIAEQTIPADATLDFVTSNTNKKITKADFISELGATGTLVQEGDVLGTPVLNIQGAVNNIRNMEDGPGWKASVSPQGGVTGEHNFIFNTAGASLSDDPTIASPVFRSLANGPGIAISASGNTITITATGAVQPSNLIIINSESDFPTQDGSTITLTANNIFSIGSTFSTAKRFIFQNGAVITMGNQFGNTLTYTGTLAMFTGSDVDATVSSIKISSPTASQTFDMTDTTNTKLFIVRSTTVVSTPKWGTYTGFLTTIVESSNALSATQGVTIAGTGQLITNMEKFALVSTNAAFIGVDLGSVVIPNIELMDLIIVSPAGGIGIKGLASNGNIPANSLAKLSSSSFSGGMTTELSGITENDFRWEFIGNTGISDTRPDGLVALTDNATETVISGDSTDGSNAVLVAGTWTTESSSHFTVTTGGRITYNGERDFHGPIDFPASLLMASGSNKEVAVYLAINGTVETKTRQIMTVSGTVTAAVPLTWQHVFTTNDFVEIFVENRADATNIIVSNAVGRVN